jgi:hypothetical protein
MKKTLLRLSAVSVMALSFTTGIAAAHSGSIDDTGRDSTNKVTFADHTETDVNNKSNIKVQNNNPQAAFSGDARVSNNEEGGAATSGEAFNDNIVKGTLKLNNSASSAAALNGSAASHTGTVADTGRDSYNSVSFWSSNSTQVRNTSNVEVVNNNAQLAKSGDATVSNNEAGGNAGTGPATNQNFTELNLEVTN